MTVVQLTQKIVTFILVADIGFAYKLVCPHSSQRQLRSQGFCAIKNSTKSVYTCLEDINENKFVESCSEEEDVVGAGERYVVKGESTNGDCSTQRYQPIPFYKTSGSECMFLISGCSESGQVTGMNGLGKNDTTCICDYNNGYAYVTRPDDVCNCKPTREDCTCYEKHCPENRRLSADNECIYRSAFSKTKCTSITSVGSMSVVTTSVLTALLERKSDNSAFILAWCIFGISTCFLITCMLICWYKYRNILGIKRNGPASHVNIDNNSYPAITSTQPEELQLKEKRQDTEIFYIKIIGNWEALKKAMNPRELFLSLIEKCLMSKPEWEKLKDQSPYIMKNNILSKLLEASKKQQYIANCEEILALDKELMKIFHSPIKIPKWHKHGIDICRKQVAKNEKLLKTLLDPNFVLDYFLQWFVFQLEQYYTVLDKDVRSEMVEIFLLKIVETLHRGSFECLLTALERIENERPSCFLTELTKGLVEASLTSGKFWYVQGNEHVEKVKLSIVVEATLHREHTVQVIKCIPYFFEEFGLYLEHGEDFTDILLYPLVNDIEERLRRGIQNGALSGLLENIFADYKSTNPTCNVKLNILLKTDASKDNITDLIKQLKSSYEQTTNKNIKLLQNLDEESVTSDDIKRLKLYSKLKTAGATILPEIIMVNFSSLAEMGTEAHTFIDLCNQREIFTMDYFDGIENNFNKDSQFIEILKDIVKDGKGNAVLALLEALYINNLELLAADILLNENHDFAGKEVKHGIITQQNETIDSKEIIDDTTEPDAGRLFFSGEFILRTLE